MVIKNRQFTVPVPISCVSAPPKLDKEIHDQRLQCGDQFKIKIPFSGTGPFNCKVKRNGKELIENERIKISPFDNFITFVIKGS